MVIYNLLVLYRKFAIKETTKMKHVCPLTNLSDPYKFTAYQTTSTYVSSLEPETLMNLTSPSVADIKSA